MSALRFENVTRSFRTRRGDVVALDRADLAVREGEFLVLKGPSGSGKTTLLLTAGGLLSPSEGRVLVGGRDVYEMPDGERARFRRKEIGFVFQLYHLVPYLSLLENVLLAAAGPKGAALEKARAYLALFRLAGREHHKPSELSAGERQRAAVARALINSPRLVLADEPTGNLDPENAEAVLECLAGYHREGGTVVLATHGTDADRRADRVLLLREGRIEKPAEA